MFGISCRTVTGLQKAIRTGKRAYLNVYTNGCVHDTPGAWAKDGDRITLNLGNGHFVIVGERVYNEVRRYLQVVS